MILNREIVKKIIDHYYNSKLLSIVETEKKRDELINLFSENEFETFIKTFPNYQVELEKYIRENMPIGDYEIAGFKVNVSYKHKSQLPAAIKSESHEDEYSNDSSIESISKTGNKTRSSIKYFKSLLTRIVNLPTRKKIGYILLTPGIWSVFAFIIITLFDEFPFSKAIQLSDFNNHWTGGYDTDGGGYSSSLPIYIALMGIAGAYLIKD